MTTHNELKDILTHYKLSRSQFSKLVGVSLDTVKCWLSKPGSKRFRRIPTMKLEYIKKFLSEIND